MVFFFARCLGDDLNNWRYGADKKEQGAQGALKCLFPFIRGLCINGLFAFCRPGTAIWFGFDLHLVLQSRTPSHLNSAKAKK